MKKLTAIMAISDDNIIGTTGANGPTLPWRLPPDLKRFKELTTGHAVIMGRTTYDSIGKPLPNRDNIVVSRRRWAPESAAFENLTRSISTEDALVVAQNLDRNPLVIGGGEIYRALWPHVTHLEITRVHTNVGLGLVFAFDESQWRETARGERLVHPCAHGYPLEYTFVSYERVGAAG